MPAIVAALVRASQSPMTDLHPNSLNDDALPEDAPYLAATTRWLEQVGS